VSSLSDIGERALIAEVVRPIFNPDGVPVGVGDDCAALAVPAGSEVLASTDRVPADLTAFRLGILDYRGLGDYLGRLNLSDIAASGGRPLGLLFNAGVPGSMQVSDFAEVCAGLQAAAERSGCWVVGGDVSVSEELSLSATVLGVAPVGQCLLRGGAVPGDAIFATRSVGLTPAAFATVASECPMLELDGQSEDLLLAQFTAMEPLLELGEALRCHGATSLTDNTDGFAQSLHHLAEASEAAFVVETSRLQLHPVVRLVAEAVEARAAEFALGPGADFSLVGTIDPAALPSLPAEVMRVGTVEEGAGVWLSEGGSRRSVAPSGWNYFQGEPEEIKASVMT
jgi:thiamine-monophosphate kinase